MAAAREDVAALRRKYARRHRLGRIGLYVLASTWVSLVGPPRVST